MKTKEIKYEEDILASFEKGEWQSVPDLKFSGPFGQDNNLLSLRW